MPTFRRSIRQTLDAAYVNGGIANQPPDANVNSSYAIGFIALFITFIRNELRNNYAFDKFEAGFMAVRDMADSTNGSNHPFNTVGAGLNAELDPSINFPSDFGTFPDFVGVDPNNPTVRFDPSTGDPTTIVDVRDAPIPVAAPVYNTTSPNQAPLSGDVEVGLLYSVAVDEVGLRHLAHTVQFGKEQDAVSANTVNQNLFSGGTNLSPAGFQSGNYVVDNIKMSDFHGVRKNIADSSTAGPLNFSNFFISITTEDNDAEVIQASGPISFGDAADGN